MSEKWISAGGVVVDLANNNLVCIIKPSNDYGPWTFPKGRVDDGESHQATALREVEEESGIVAKIISGGYLGSGVGGYSITHYYMMEKVSDTGTHDFETEEVKFVDINNAIQLFKEIGNSRDLMIAEKAKVFIDNMQSEKKSDSSSSLNENSILLSEVKLNMMGKIFFATCAAWLVGKLTKTKIRGSKKEIETLQSAMLSSRKFQDELRRPGATVQSVTDKLKLKNASANEFQRILGIPWPL
jgi:ADP-ribose pyrophosphatase YjhB (NUDIX family)